MRPCLSLREVSISKVLKKIGCLGTESAPGRTCPRPATAEPPSVVLSKDKKCGRKYIVFERPESALTFGLDASPALFFILIEVLILVCAVLSVVCTRKDAML